MLFNLSNELANHKLQVILLDCPYDTYRESKFTRDLLSDVFKLKLDGYLAHYKYGMLPISDFDFMAKHIILCKNVNEVYYPLAAFKSISNETCKRFNIDFPAINHKFGKFKADFMLFVDAMNTWQTRLEVQNKVYAYNASWTMQPDIEKNLRNICREISIAMFYFFYNTEKIEHVINSTSEKYKVNKLQEFMGLKYLNDEAENTLSSFRSPAFQQEPFFLMYLDQQGFSADFVKECQKYKQL